MIEYQPCASEPKIAKPGQELGIERGKSHGYGCRAREGWRAAMAHNGCMAYQRKSWAQKWAEAVAKPDLPKVWDCPEAKVRFVVPNPAEVEEIVRRVPKGQVVRLSDIASELAEKHGTDTCCPMTTGIFAWILAHAAAEDELGDLATVPWWRMVKAKGELNAKYPGAPELQKSLLEAEGRTITRKGRRLFVEGIA